jgi:hypothetical protein
MNNDSTADGDEDTGVNKMNIADSCIMAIVTIVFVGMVLVTAKVYRIVKLGDKRLMLMLGFLDLTLLGKYIST